ncbi:hypothetical protein CWC07_13865 [Pseudoalteromonas ruthenica]|nr:hypothetical protein CWC07_13865 [Pseudoalteromonas ruthenica]
MPLSPPIPPKEPTPSLTASRWAVFKARLFGKKFVTIDSGYRIVIHNYKGVSYVTSTKKIFK